MSWSLSGVISSTDELETGLTGTDLTNADEWTEGQVRAAKMVAKQLLDSGVIGKDKRYSVGMSGHANPGHEPQGGYSNDQVYVSIGQVTTNA